MTRRHRYAAHYLYTSSSGYLKQYGIEIEDMRVVRIFPAAAETESTEWLPGVIELEMSSDHQWEIWHYYPFDFIHMMSVSETQRRRLL